MEREAAYEEIEELKGAMEKLMVEYHQKMELSESLRRACNEHLARFQEARIRLDEQERQLSVKSDELVSVKRMYEDTAANLRQKEQAVQQLSSANDQIRANCREKIAELEGKNRNLASALDEANSRVESQQQELCFCREEVKALKILLGESQRKCSEAEQRALAARELKAREEVLLKLENDSTKTVERLKWKTEQFQHLEEAHRILQDQFRESKKEWAAERSTLIKEMCSLQKNLESQTRMAKDLRKQLELCNQALAHEESRRKLLEIQVSDSRMSYEKAISECKETRLQIENLTQKRDGEIATVRNLLASRGSALKEMEFQNAELKNENQELHSSLKEAQEALISEGSASLSLKSLRQKLRCMELTHKDNQESFKAKEVKWNSDIKKLETDLSVSMHELTLKDRKMKNMQFELEGCYSSMLQLKLEIEEKLVVLSILMSKFSEIQSTREEFEVQLRCHLKQQNDQIDALRKQLESKNGVLAKNQACIEKEQETINALVLKVESLEFFEQQYSLIQKELKNKKDMLEDSVLCLNRLKKDASNKEKLLEEKLQKLSYSLEDLTVALSEKENEVCRLQFELQQCNSVLNRVEKSKADALAEAKVWQDECESIRKALEASTILKTENAMSIEKLKELHNHELGEKDLKIHNLQQEISNLRDDFERKLEAVAKEEMAALNKFDMDKQSFLQTLKAKDSILNNLFEEVVSVTQQSMQREVEAVVGLEQERLYFDLIKKEKDTLIVELQKRILLQEQLSKSVETAISLQLADRQYEIDALNDFLKKNELAYFLDLQELEFKKLMVSDVESQLELLEKRLHRKEKLAIDLENKIKILQAALEQEISEKEKKNAEFEVEFEKLHCRIREMHASIMQFVTQREKMAAEFTDISNTFDKIYSNDELSRKWERVANRAELTDECRDMDGKVKMLAFSQSKQKTKVSPFRNKFGSDFECRSPLKEYNGYV